MVLVPECVRDVLLAVESCALGKHLNLDTLGEQLPQYSQEDLWYTVLKLDEGGYLDVVTVPVQRQTIPGIKSINDLTFLGHEFLNTIRSDSIWEKTKTTAKKAGVFSLKAIFDIGKTIAAAAITTALQ